ncbi:polyadenylate-binding protein-interacting protein 12 isoform X2 [Ricinus communis]|uniref:polyadenylate-binding protein-interacting protein 12 isoform X2 n=1 Tax=Ricinus communis TaxID=3988 RepID=UPI000772CB7A|nr:polyadenylate-binding protein-interacting protein 12 isoform X2 [Ricinus communis]|eukprot:XP_015574472.1 polyadenylate-binding protein-interacting protein 12 isoform X2 [Ricinus communis]
MAIVENASVDLGISIGSASSSSSSLDSSVSSASSNDQDHSNHNNSHDHGRSLIENSISIQPLYMKAQVQSPPPNLQVAQLHHHHQRSSGGGDLQRDIRELQELFSKLNPMAEEFVPPSLANNKISNNYIHGLNGLNVGFYTNNNNYDPAFMLTNASRNGQLNGSAARRKNYNQGKRRLNSRTSMAQREEIIRRTVYVSDIDQQVTEEQLAALFVGCGQVVDCRICGDPNSVLRFAFIEFTHEEGARAALNLAGTVLGYYPVRVLPSKTAIAPVNPTFLPRSDDEREMCIRTIYCTNIDKKVTQADVKLFFESVCGEVYRLRLLGDYHHSTRIAFVEFVMAESAIAALNCSGVVLGSLPIRVSPSKTPVRPRAPRIPMH